MNTDLLKAVVEARETERLLKGEKDASHSAWLETNAVLMRDYADAIDETHKAEEALRESALGEYEATGDKKPFPGVGIRVIEKPIYVTEMALAWAHEHHQALSLNTKEFEAIIKAMAVKPSFVAMEQQVTATIATDLAKVLEEVKG